MTDVETLLRDTLADHAEHIPVERDIDAIRSAAPAASARRPAPTAKLVAVAAALIVVIAAATIVIDTSRGGSRAWAGWTPAAQPATPADTAAVEGACRAAMTDPQRPEPGEMVALDVRGDGGFAVFSSGSTCTVHREGRDSFRAYAGSYSWTTNEYEQALDQLDAADSVVWAWSSESNDPPNSFTWGVAGPDITSVTLQTPHGAVDTTMAGQIWLAWWPDTTGFDMTLEARDSTGTIVVSAGLEDLSVDYPMTPGEQACATGTDDCPTIRAAEIIAAIPADDPAQQIVADGYISADEFASWLAGVEACMTSQGYDITLAPAGVDGIATDYPLQGQPGPVEPALTACYGASNLAELWAIQQAYPNVLTGD